MQKKQRSTGLGSQNLDGSPWAMLVSYRTLEAAR